MGNCGRAGSLGGARRLAVVRRREKFAVGVNKRRRAPASERHMLLQRNFETIRPLAPHINVAHPRQLFETGARALEVERKEVALDFPDDNGLDLFDRYMRKLMRNEHFAQRKSGEPYR